MLEHRMIGTAYRDVPFEGLPCGFGYHIKWGDQTFTIRGAPSYEEAKRQCIKWASDNGWTPPQWWQFWRWGDTKP